MLLNNLQPPLWQPADKIMRYFIQKVLLAYLVFLYIKLFLYSWLYVWTFTWWWWSSENKWSPSRCLIASTIESRFCLEDWEVVQTEIFGTLGRLGILAVPGTFCTFGTMQTSGVNLKKQQTFQLIHHLVTITKLNLKIRLFWKYSIFIFLPSFSG